MLAQEFRNNSIHETVNQVDMFCEYSPNILKWLYDEMQESLEDANVTERDAIREFEQRKLDHKYSNMIE